MRKYVKVLFLSLLMTFSANTWGQSPVDFSTLNVLKESFKVGQKNTVISGLSIIFATDMLANGATGKSFDELTAFLGTSIENTNSELHEKITNLPQTLEISNSIWGNEFRESYKDLLIQLLNVSVEPLPANTSTINDWIAEKTHDKITSVLQPKQTEPLNLYLVNTIYFKDNWESQFKKENTRDKIFNSLSGLKVNIPMMNKTDSILYAENDKVQSIKLPYKNGGFMIVYLPKENVNFNEFISSLSVDDLDLNYSKKQVAVTLPKMKIEKDTNLNEIFVSLGVNEIFNTNTKDFNKMALTNPYVEKIAHKAIIEIDEEGTVAAAATVVKMSVKSMPQRIQFNANRPFLFVITQGDFIGFYTGNN